MISILKELWEIEPVGIILFLALLVLNLALWVSDHMPETVLTKKQNRKKATLIKNGKEKEWKRSLTKE